jgi:ATP-dependent RNA helicase DeaD
MSGANPRVRKALTMTDFDGVVPALRDAMTARGYHDLTPVQKAVLAPDAGGGDALVSAQTGSGKTVAFGLAVAETLLGGDARFGRAEAPLALIVAPTRELALQIRREFEWLYAATGAVIGSCVGGMDMRSERRLLEQGAHIVIGTPGRLRDHIQRHSLITTSIRTVVLDEADEMLDLGFREDLEFILAATPEERRTLLFSATVPRGIASLAQNYQRDAVRISTTEEKKQHSDIEYRALTVAASDRENAIVNLLRFYEARNALIFCATRATVNYITARFKNRGFSVVALSGELTQGERSHALQAMRDGRARVCIATDVAARGIDLPNLELVIHADLPTNAETLLHRSGRTGRAGRKGVSTLIVPHNRRRSAERLLADAKITATWDRPPSAEEVRQRDDERLLAHEALSEPAQEGEAELIQQLLARYGIEEIARAFIHVARDGQSAPEELQDVAVSEPKKRQSRQNFESSVWYSLSIGRKQKAEPGWLLPVLCRGGDLNKQDIGAIRVQQEHTFVEVDAESAERFEAGIGPNNTLEKNIRVKRLESPPELGHDPGRKSGGFKSAHGPAKKRERFRSDAPQAGDDGKPEKGKPKKYAPKHAKSAKSGFEPRKRKEKRNASN